MILGADQHEFYRQVIFTAIGKEADILEVRFQSGGCISTAALLITSFGHFFLKWNTLNQSIFEAEESGLTLLRNSCAVKIPEVYAVGRINDLSFILMEFLEHGNADHLSYEQLGRNLAALHANSSEFFGLSEDNYIGSLDQKNEPKNDWLTFFIENRLNVQAGLAYYNGLVDKDWLQRFKSIYPYLEDFFPNEQPSLLHGDLWSGNIHAGPNGDFYLIDPAVYFGHREAELAFTELFGGFQPHFYGAYHEVFPLQPGYSQRKDVYNLYPLLVHANLFGASYLRGVERVIERFI
jgi:fructosamine-3-kinase